MAKLIIKDENGVERVHELVDEVTTVGRSSSTTIQITDEKSSRNHFRVEKEGEFFKVVDLGSTNGTRLNGERVASLRLKPGDELKVGQTSFRYDGPGEVAPAKPAAPPALDRAPAEPALPSETKGVPQPEEKKADAPKYILVVLEGQESGQRFELGREPLTIGRHASNRVPIEDESASSYHAEIAKAPMGYVVSDLGSTNGTKVKAKGGAEFVRIVKTPLAAGMQVRIGKTVFEYRNVGGPSSEDQMFGTVVLDEEKVAQKLGAALAPRPERQTSSLPPLVLGAAAMLVFAGVLFAVVKLVPPGGSSDPTAGQPKPPAAPPNTANRIVNGDFSQGTDDRGEAKGWKSIPGQPGVVRVVVDKDAERNPDLPDEQKKGLAILKAGATSSSCQTVVETVDSFPVDPGKVYEIAGALKNDGDGQFGLRVRWIKGDRSLPDHHEVLMTSQQEWKDRHAEVRPPSWAEAVRVGVFTEGREGRTCFDNLSFREKPEGKAEKAPTVSFGGVSIHFEGSKGAFSATSGGLPALEDAVLELVSKDQKACSSLISARVAQLSQLNGKTVYRGEIFDFVQQKPTTYLVGAHDGAGGVQMRFAVDPQPGESSEPRLRFHVTGPAALGEIELLREGGVEKLGARDQGQFAGVQALLFNPGKTPQLYLTFSVPVSVDTRSEGRRREVLIGFQTQMEMEVAPENVGEKRQLAHKLKELDEVLARKDWNRVWKLAEEIDGKFRGRFHEAKEGTRSARDRYEAAFQPVKQELARKLEDAKQLPNLAKAMRESMLALRPAWSGTPHDEDFRAALNHLDAVEKAGVNQGLEDEAQRKLATAQRNYDKEVYPVAISYCNIILKDYKNTKAAVQAQELLKLAEEKQGKANVLSGITRKLKDKSDPFVAAGDYAEAIKAIKADAEYKKFSLELVDINTLLEVWKKKLDEK